MGESSISIDGTEVAAASMDGVGIISGSKYAAVNDALAEIHRFDTTQDLVGQPWNTLYSPEDGEGTAGELLTRAREDGQWRGRAFGLRRNGDGIPVELSMRTTDDGVICVVRDVNEKISRERKLERYETILKTVDDGIYVLDENLKIETANGRFFEMLSQFGISRKEARDSYAHKLLPREEDRTALKESIDEAINNEPHTGSFEISAEMPTGETIVCESRFRLYPEPLGEYRGCIGILRDITERKERESELPNTQRFNEELVENAPFSMVRIDEEFQITYVNPRTEEVTGLPDGKESEALGVDIRELPSVAETGESHVFTPLKDGETIEFEFPFESLYGRKVYFTGRGVPLMSGQEFAGAVLMAVDISERRQQEKDLERQRDELDTLNQINELLLAVARDLFESPMQEDIEQTVCGRLAASDLYQFAWIGKPEEDGNQLVCDTVAGADDDYVESITVMTNETENGQGPAGRAFRTGAVQVSQDVQADPTFEPWREAATARNIRSVAAVPLAYDGTTYGVLAVYTSRPLAFSQREQRGFEMLGEATGYAINANRTRQLLFAEKVTELKFRVDDSSEFVSDASHRLGCSLSLEGYISTDDESWLMYFSVPEADADRFVDLARSDPAVESVRAVRRDSGKMVAVTTSSSLLDEIVAFGGRITSGSIDAGRWTFVVEVPQSTTVAEFVKQMRSVYPGADLLAKRDGEQPAERSRWLSEEATVNFTERQRQALEAAYLAGYFEWPRENSAEDVADLLEISRPTLQAHLRKAEDKLLGVFLEEGSEIGERPGG